MNNIRVTAATLFLSAVCGCWEGGDRTVRVTGAATLDGKPLANAGVRFHCLVGGLHPPHRTLTGTTDGDGKFEFPRVYPQVFQVSFFLPEDPASEGPVGPDGQPVVLAVPRRGPLGDYSADTTQLTARVTAESNHFEFALKAKQ